MLAVASFTADDAVFEGFWSFETSSVYLIDAHIAGLTFAFFAIMDELSILSLTASMADTPQSLTEYFSSLSAIVNSFEEFSDVLLA